MKLHENIESAYVLIKQKKSLEEKIEVIDKQIQKLKVEKEELQKEANNYDEQINPYKELIFEMMKEATADEVEVNDVIAKIMSRNGFVWKDEASITKYLQDNKLDDYITVKYSLKKSDLKKAIENDPNLKEALTPYIETKDSKYLVITDKDSYSRMLAHMEDNK